MLDLILDGKMLYLLFLEKYIFLLNISKSILSKRTKKVKLLKFSY